MRKGFPVIQFAQNPMRIPPYISRDGRRTALRRTWAPAMSDKEGIADAASPNWLDVCGIKNPIFLNNSTHWLTSEFAQLRGISRERHKCARVVPHYTPHRTPCAFHLTSLERRIPSIGGPSPEAVGVAPRCIHRGRVIDLARFARG